MIATHNEILKNIYLGSPKNRFHGRKAFEPLHARFLQLVGESKNDAPQALCDFAENDIGHYLRYFCITIKFVDDSSDIPNKKSYTDILRSQFSGYELFLF